MKNNLKLHWILAAAASAALSIPAMAQYRVGTDGRALDANNRVGSGGLNQTSQSPQMPTYGQLGNNIVTDNVTGGRGFRGFVPYTSPDAFRGNTAGGLSDRFIAESSGTPYGNLPTNNAQVVQPFYGQSTFIAPQAGFTQQNSTGAIVPTPTITQQAGDLRLGETLDVPQSVLPPPGQLILPGPVDSNTQTNTSSLITASPLYGVRQWNTANASDQAFIQGNLGGTTAQPSKIDPITLQQIRSELLQPPTQQNNDQNQNQDQTQNGQQQSAVDNSAGVPFESPQNQPLNNTPTARNGANGIALGGPNNLSTGASLQQRVLMSPQQQSRQYAELQTRLQQYRIVQQQTLVNAQKNTQPLRNQPGEKNGATAAQANTPNGQIPIGQVPQMAQPNPSPTIAEQPTKSNQKPELPQTPAETNATQQPAPGDLQRPKPLQVHSLAEGVQAKGLADLLKEAEDQMKAQHYTSALEDYEMAEQVAPNNPLILLGRANAELGQSYYTRADNHLRQAFAKNEELLMGQYDLKTFLGDERLTFLVQDLKEIAKRDQKESRPLFLLAYIAYNTGNERRAAAYLDLAEKRAGGKDPFYALIRKHWALPSAQGANPADVLNK
jgi:hypothetical protein